MRLAAVELSLASYPLLAKRRLGTQGVNSHNVSHIHHTLGWPEPYIYTVYDQACRVVRYGTVTVCTVRTVLVKLRRTTVIVTHLGLARTVYIHRI